MTIAFWVVVGVNDCFRVRRYGVRGGRRALGTCIGGVPPRAHHLWKGAWAEPAGVGKTLSARRYAHWDLIGPFIKQWGPRADSDVKVYAAAHRARTVFYTPQVAATMKALRADLDHDLTHTNICIEEHLRLQGQGVIHYYGPTPSLLELVIVDEAERLPPNAIEWLRDQYD